MLYKSHLLLLELWDMVDMVDGYCFMGPSGRFFIHVVILGIILDCLGQVICRFKIG